MSNETTDTKGTGTQGTGTQGTGGKGTASQGTGSTRGKDAGSQDAKKSTGAVAITERAAKEVKRVIQENDMPEETWVRIGAKGGGCSGMTYVLDFDQNGPTEFDLTFEQHGVKVIIDKKSSFFMSGTTLDFNDGLLNRGFVFQNPTATGTCGCGTSFST